MALFPTPTETHQIFRNNPLNILFEVKKELFYETRLCKRFYNDRSKKLFLFYYFERRKTLKKF